MGILVMLIEGIRAPKDAVAVRAGVTFVTLVELILVPLPVELSLKGNVAECAPVSAGGFGAPSVVALDGGHGRHGQLWRRSNFVCASPESTLG